MELTILRKIQYIEQDILDYVVEFCEKNNINYWLDWGTLLGSIRHEGFIPWDDDIDIGMLREDYDRFKKKFELEVFNDSYKLITEKETGNHFIKIINVKQECYSKEEGIKNNVWIDIFPFDTYPIESLAKIKKYSYYKEKINLLRKRKNIYNKLKIEVFKFLRRKLEVSLEKKQK